MATIYDRLNGTFGDFIGGVKCGTAVVGYNSALTSIGAGDVILLAPLAKGQLVRRVHLIVDTAENSAATVDVGIVTWTGSTSNAAVNVDADGFLNGVAINGVSAGTTYATLEANTLDQGYYVTGDTTYLALVSVNALDTAKLRVIYDVVQPEPQTL